MSKYRPRPYDYEEMGSYSVAFSVSFGEILFWVAVVLGALIALLHFFGEAIPAIALVKIPEQEALKFEWLLSGWMWTIPSLMAALAFKLQRGKEKQ